MSLSIGWSCDSCLRKAGFEPGSPASRHTVFALRQRVGDRSHCANRHHWQAFTFSAGSQGLDCDPGLGLAMSFILLSRGRAVPLLAGSGPKHAIPAVLLGHDERVHLPSRQGDATDKNDAAPKPVQ